MTNAAGILHVRPASPVRDLLTGENVGVGPHLPLRLKRGETRVLEY